MIAGIIGLLSLLIGGGILIFGIFSLVIAFIIGRAKKEKMKESTLRFLNKSLLTGAVLLAIGWGTCMTVHY